MDIPISNQEAEKHVLSCLIIEPTLINICFLEARHFSDKLHTTIFEAMRKIASDGNVIDIPSLIQLCPKIESGYFWGLGSYVMFTHNFEQHCELILENYNRRQIKEKCSKVLNYVQDTTIPYTKIIADITDVLSTDEVEKANTISPGIVDTVEKLFDKKESIMVLDDMGFDCLNTILGGYRGGAFYIIGARPSVGKSTFAMNLAYKAMLQKKKVSIFSLEMAAQEIQVRMLSMLTAEPIRKIEQGKEEVAEKVIEQVNHLGEIGSCSIHTDVTLENIQRLISLEVSKGVEIIFIDYVQLIKSRNKFGTKDLLIGEVTSTIKQSAIKYGISIVGLAQINRESEKSGQAPQLKDLRDSGNLEQDADAVMFLHGYDDYSKELEIYVRKNRNGSLGEMKLGYKKDIFTFYDL